MGRIWHIGWAFLYFFGMLKFGILRCPKLGSGIYSNRLDSFLLPIQGRKCEKIYGNFQVNIAKHFNLDTGFTTTKRLLWMMANWKWWIGLMVMNPVWVWGNILCCQISQLFIKTSMGEVSKFQLFMWVFPISQQKFDQLMHFPIVPRVCAFKLKAFKALFDVFSSEFLSQQYQPHFLLIRNIFSWFMSLYPDFIQYTDLWLFDLPKLLFIHCEKFRESW